MKMISRLLIGVMLALLPLATSALAQDKIQEKRIALVVGNATYPNHPLATAANDGGLIAQTLQAAGFDVAGARDLDAESLRRALRDFVQKAQTSGPDTVAVLYLAGYGLQLAGENYFVPVDAAPARDTDVAVDTLRVSDYIRQLQALPLKAGVVVLDAAREQPFAQGGQPLAGGLALVEPDPKILIAFNAAPGTVAPNEPGPYGAYAQALAQMIRTGGLTLPEVFDRARLRVSELTKGAQIPWDTRTLQSRVVLFERAPDAPQTTVALSDRSKPIASYGASDAYAAALARDTLVDYDAFVAAYPGDPLAKRVRAIIAARREAITWRRSFNVNTPDAYWSYLQRYPRGPHAYDARRRLAFLTAPLAPPPTFAAIVYDVPPPPPDEIVYVDRPYLVFNDPVFAFVPPPPPPVYFLPPPPPDFVVLAPPPPVFGLFVLPRPYFVPMPAYVVAPPYVAPPPNNIIFANIHNTTVINNVINQPAPAAPAQGQGQAQGQAQGSGIATPAAAPGSPALPPSVAQRASLIQQGKIAAPAGVSPAPAVSSAAQPIAPAAGVVTPQALNRTAVSPTAASPNASAASQAAKPLAAPQAATPATPQAAAMSPAAPKPSATPQAPAAAKQTPASQPPLASTAASQPKAKPAVAERAPKPDAAARPASQPAPRQAAPRPAPPPRPQVQRPPPPRQAMARPASPRPAPPRPHPAGKPPKH